MRYLLIISLFLAFLSVSCSNSATSQKTVELKRYPLKGKIVSIDKEKKKVEVAHEKIEGFMEPMTMSFSLKGADWAFDELQKDSYIQAELVVDNVNSDYWLENFAISVAQSPGQTTPPVNPNFAQIGKDVPNFTLTNQDGKQINFNDFRGKAWALTFIYTRCPLPEYCIKMSTNFSDAANALKDNPELKDKVKLLTISFDPATDTPTKLRQYGLGYLGNNPKSDFKIWQLAVAPDEKVRPIADFFGLNYEISPENKTEFNHSLRTAVITPEGKVSDILSGSSWTAEELIAKLQKTLK